MAPDRSPLFLRVLYVLVFGGLAVSAWLISFPEWLQLWTAWGAPYHPGTPPAPLLILSGAAAAVGGLLLLVHLFTGRMPALAVGAGLVGALLVSMFGRSPEFRHRSWAAADLVILEVGRELHLAMKNQLQRNAAVPAELEAWQKALAQVVAARSAPHSPIRDRAFRPQPFQVVRVASEGARPRPLRPASYLLWISEDAVSFQLTPVGLSQGGEVDVLRDDRGGVVVLKGVYNPDMATQPNAAAAAP